MTILTAFGLYAFYSSDMPTAYVVANDSLLQQQDENSAPLWIAAKTNFTIGINSSLTLNLQNYFYDSNDDEITFLAAVPEGFGIIVDGNLIKITPKQGFNGDATITLIASDMLSTARKEIILSVQPGISATEQIILNSHADIDEDLLNQFELGEIVRAIILFEQNSSTALPELPLKERLIEVKNTLIEKKEIDFGYNLANPNSYDLEVEREYTFINAIAVKLTKRGLNRLKENPAVEGIISDRVFNVSEFAENLKLINIDDAHAENAAGAAATLCLLDTGIAPNVFTANLIGGYDFVNSDSEPFDDNNHGTHVAGIFNSIAPAARIVPAKVCSQTGTCTAANILAGIDYCLENQQYYNISIMSGSFGDRGEYSEENCPFLFDSALAIAENHNITNVFASGNDGYKTGISYPACSPHALGVGAVDNNDTIASFSNIGSALDALAPGVDINSTVINGYAIMSGTSMATPHAAGVIALLQSAAAASNKTLTAEGIKAVFDKTSVKIENYSRIDAYAGLLYLDNYTLNKSSYSIQKGRDAKIQFYQPVDFDSIRKCSRIAHNYVEIFPNCPQYNQSARITMWDINTSNAIILKDGLPCPADSCYNIEQQNATIAFDVNGFSFYQAADSLEFSISAPILSCPSTISSPGVYWTGVNPLYAALSNDCILVTANNVWFNCYGGTIAFDGIAGGFIPGIGIEAQNVSNFTLVNCNIRNFEKGIYFYNTSNSSVGFFNLTPVSNYIFNNTLTGITLNISNNNSITENAFYNDSRVGIFLYNSSNNSVLNNFAYNNTIGVWLNNSHNNSLLDHEDNRFNGHNNISMLFIDSFDNLFGSTTAPWSNFTTPIIFQNSTHGEINYSLGLNLSDGVQYFIQNFMRIEENFTRVDSVNAARLNRSATLTFRNLSLTDPFPIHDFEDDGNYTACPVGTDITSICANISFASGTYVYNVTHFTTFAAASTTPATTPPPYSPKGGHSGTPGTAVKKIIRTAPPPASTPPAPAPTPPAPQLQTPSVIGQALSQSALKDTSASCGYILNTLAERRIAFSEEINERMERLIPSGYKIISKPMKIECAGEYLDLSFNLPANYKDIRAMRCNQKECVELAKEISENELVCGGKSITEIRKEELSKRDSDFWMPEEMGISYGKLLTNRDRIISSDDYKIELLASIKEQIAVRIETPAFNVPQPKNPSLSIIGSPLQIAFETEPGNMRMELTMPFINLEGFDEESFAIYWLNQTSNEWEYLGNRKNKNSIVIEIIDIDKYFKDKKAIFAVLGIKCINCLESDLSLVYNPGTRDAVVLVHGFTSSPLTWQFVIDDLVLNKQPFQIWTFGYPSTSNIETIANEFAKHLELHANEYDNIYFVGHSLGGLVVQDALAQASKIGRYSFISKIKDVIIVGTPNEGSPAAEVYYNLFKSLLNKKSFIKLFDVNSVLVKQLSKGKIIPRLPDISYEVIAGTSPYVFNLGLFTISTENILKFVAPNDGIVAVKSAQHVGNTYINNSCLNFFAINVTHTELISDATSRRVLEKLIASKVAKKENIPLIGFNQYARLQVNNCKSGDIIIFIGKEIKKAAMPDVLDCSCGNNVCGLDETVENCPQDCAIISKVRNLLQGWARDVAYAVAILFFTVVVFAITKKAYGMHRKKNTKYLKKELERIKESLD